MEKSLFLAQIVSVGIIAYPIIFVSMMIEGDVVIFISFFLVSSGILDPATTFLVVFFGTIIGDTLWYHVGLTSEPKNKLSLWILNSSSKLTSKFDNHIKEKTFRAVFVSKFTYGFHHLILLRAGIIKTNFRKFIEIDILATIIWIIIIGSLGYASGASFELIKHKLEHSELGVLAAVIIFIIIGEIISKILRKKI